MDRTTFACALIAFALLGAGCEQKPAVAAPDFIAESIRDQNAIVKLSDLKGKVVVVDFWATWCGPCRETMPTIQAMSERFADNKDVVFMGLSSETRSTIMRFQRSNPNLDYPLMLDRGGQAQRQYSLGGIPILVVIDRQGNVAYRHDGAPIDETAFENAIRGAL